MNASATIANIDPAVQEYLREYLLNKATDADPYRKALSFRALLCERALTIRSSDPELAERFLNTERAIADAMRTGLNRTGAVEAAGRSRPSRPAHPGHSPPPDPLIPA